MYVRCVRRDHIGLLRLSERSTVQHNPEHGFLVSLLINLAKGIGVRPPPNAGCERPRDFGLFGRASKLNISILQPFRARTCTVSVHAAGESGVVKGAWGAERLVEAQEHQLGAPVSVGQREPLDQVRALRSSVVTFGY